MGKRNDKTILAGTVGFSKVRHCLEHNEQVRPVKVFKRKAMMFECTQGCKLDKSHTILKTPEGPQHRKH